MVICRKFEVVLSFNFGIRWDFVQKTKWWTITLLLALWESFLSWQLTWFLMVKLIWPDSEIGKKCKEALRRSTRVMIAYQRRCWSCWGELQPFRGEFAGYGLLDVSEAAKSKPGIQWVDLVTLPKTEISVSALRWFRCLPTRHRPVLTTTSLTVIYVCVPEELALWALSFQVTVDHLKQNDAQDKKFRLSTTDGQKGRRTVLRKRRKGYEKKQVEKEGVSHEPGGFSTSFVFFLVYFIAHLSSLKLFFSSHPAPKTPYLYYL